MQQHKARHGAEHRQGHPVCDRVVAVEAGEEEPEMLHVLRDLAVEDRQELHQHEEDARRQGVGHDLGHGLNGLLCPASNRANRFMTRQNRISRAGPEAKAEARNRGAMIAVSQKLLPGRPA